MPTPNTQCPVHGCGVWSNRWGEKSYPLPSADILTLQLDTAISPYVNNRICQPCWKRHRDHTMGLDGRTRVVPTVSSSPLDALLSPLPSAPASLPSPPSLSSLPSPPPNPALALPCLQLPHFNRPYFHHLPAATQPSFARQQVACLQKRTWKQNEVATAQSAQNESQTTASEQLGSGMDTRVSRLYNIVW